MTRFSGKPPRTAEQILAKIARGEERTSILGDFEEIYNDLAAESGRFRAKTWYWSQVLKSLPQFLKNQIFGRMAMFKNFIKVALRNMIKSKGYSFLNIAGLAAGMACCALVMFWVQDELSFDRFHQKADRLYAVISILGENFGDRKTQSTPSALGEALKKDIPEIEKASRFLLENELTIRAGDKALSEDGVSFVDTGFFEMLTFQFLEGTPSEALSRPDSIVLSNSAAGKIFGNRNSLGQRLTINGTIDLTVSGVVKDPPSNSFLRFINYWIPFENLKRLGGEYAREDLLKWERFFVETYVLLRPQAESETVTEKIRLYLNSVSPDSKIQLALQPLTSLHLHGPDQSQSAASVFIFSLIGVFVLLIACINFVNLATARSGRRAKEVALRKVVGADRGSLLTQFFGESLAMTVIASAMSLALVRLALPLFNSLAGKNLQLDLLGGRTIFGLLGIMLLTGVVAGIYPAFVLSSFRPVLIFKGPLKTGSGFFRKALVVIQFAISIGLIVCTLGISKQMSYMQHKALGFNRDQVMSIPLRSDLKARYDVLKAELLRNPNILHVTSASAQVGVYGIPSITGLEWEGKAPNQDAEISVLSVDYDFLETFGIELTSGRTFSREIATDSKNFILNEMAVKDVGFDSPLGKRFTFRHEGTVIGVVKNFHFRSLRWPIEPLLIGMVPELNSHAFVKVRSGDIPAAVDYVKKTVERIVPGFPFSFSFLDEEFERLYRSEQRLENLLKAFAFLAILVSCLGLFGLAAFMAEQRTKEIGIRKVLGASARDIMLLLCREFACWVLVANAVAWPVTYLVMRRWLQNFAYQTSLGPGIFVMSAALALAVALFTVSIQAVRAATANPVKALKYE
jgi:predicted permease